MKRKKYIFSILIIYVMIISFISIGCTDKNICYSMDRGFSIGFDSTLSEPDSDVKIAIKIAKSRITVGENLPIYLYYWSNYSYNEYDPNPLKVTAKISVIFDKDNKTERVVTIKKIEDFTLYTYKTVILNNDEQYKPETFTLSTDDFIYEEGAIVWGLETHILFPIGSPQEQLIENSSVALYYRVENKYIFFYKNQYEFNNNIKLGECKSLK